MSTKYFRETRIDMVNEILNLEMSITILNKGKSVGDVLDLLIYIIIRCCIKYLSSTK
jgi:hypothetical protein